MRAQYSRLQEQGRASGFDLAARAPKWPSQHAARSREDREWWLNHAPGDDMASHFPSLLALSDREADILSMHRLAMPEDKPRVLNVSPSLARTRVTEVVPCITPRARLYLTHRCRLLHGVGSLRLQSVWYGAEREAQLLATFGEQVAFDLAGDAMEGCCLSATLVAIAVVLSHGASAETRVRPPPRRRDFGR